MTASTIDISGALDPRFSRVQDAFAGNFTDGLDAGAGVAVTLDGERVVGLTAGFADKAETRPFTAATLTPVYSCTKAVVALVTARLVDQGAIAYDQTVASLWPEFASAGKEAITIEQALSHQAGLAGVADDWAQSDWLDWEKTVARLAAMTPMWRPGTQSGYHAMTFGYLAGEVVRRAVGRTLGTVLREELCGPHGIEFWIGLPEAEDGRVAELIMPRALPEFGEINPATRAALLEKWSSPGSAANPAWRRAEMPAANGIGTAAALADLMQPFARDGMLGEARVLSAEASAAARRIRITGQDLVLPYDMAFAAGLIANRPEHLVYGPSPNAVGHTGSGGSATFADPTRRLTFAYVMTKQNPTLLIDDRVRSLVDAVYASL